MAKLLNEQELREKAVRALEERLGPVEALRFLALISREPFDYQEWRRQHFADATVDALLREMQGVNKKPPREG
ncbi:MAG TPA: hypothetical protein VJO34_04135 [Methylomirabilota bacterium]|nr:hypothetical protein [Methylomirabilota bacterium]